VSEPRILPMFLAVVGLSAGFALSSVLARVSYDSGANALSVSVLRMSAACLVLALVLRAQGVPLAVPVRLRTGALLLGVVLALYSLSFYVAIGLMPVALAVIVFCTWPLIVGAGAWALGQERLTLLWPIAALGAFGGLAVALDVFTASYDRLGIVLALLAAIGWSSVFLVNRVLVGGRDSRPVTFWMQFSAFLFYVVLCLATGLFSLPTGLIGWLAYLGSALVYSGLMVSLFTVAQSLGPVRTALAMYFEPVASLIFGIILLGQTLAWFQAAGIGLVVAALLLARGASRPVARA
jgi:drug/metabolite transporter (DMT)-like permease